MTMLTFSEDFLKADLWEGGSEYSISTPSIMVNVGNAPLHIAEETLQPRHSSIFSRGSAKGDSAFLSIQSQEPFSALHAYAFRDECMKKWSHVHDIFPLPHLKNTNLWRSEKQRVGNVSFNFWFAAAGTDCGLHNKHDFLEIHTQVWGTGHMQKFLQNDAQTMYEDIFMMPGFTHEPFCPEHEHVYPWHRYFADTDCVWLAVEYS